MKRGLFLHGSIAMVSLALAYLVRAQGTESAGASEVVLSLAPADIESIRIRQDGVTLTLEVRQDQRLTRYVWVTVEQGGERIQFRGDKFADHVVAGFSPLLAKRVLGVLDEGKLKEGGLGNPESFIEVRSARGAHKLALGTVARSGEGRRILDESTRMAYLVATDLVPTPARAIQDMFEFELHLFSRHDPKEAVVTAEGRVVEVQKVELTWRWKSQPSRLAPELSSWFQSTLPILAIAPYKGQLPGEPAFKVVYMNEREEIGFLKMWEIVDPNGTSRPIAMTEYTIGPVLVMPAALQVLRDAKSIVANAPTP